MLKLNVKENNIKLIFEAAKYGCWEGRIVEESRDIFLLEPKGSKPFRMRGIANVVRELLESDWNRSHRITAEGSEEWLLDRVKQAFIAHFDYLSPKELKELWATKEPRDWFWELREAVDDRMGLDYEAIREVRDSLSHRSDGVTVEMKLHLSDKAFGAILSKI